MRLHLAGVDATDCTNVVRSGVFTNVFISYFYQRKFKSLAALRPFLGRVVIDSGAFSFLSSVPSTGGSAYGGARQNRVREDPDQFFEAFLEWLLANQPHWDYFVELDLGELLGLAKVQEWRVRIEKAGLADRCLIAWHPGVEPWPDFIKRMEKWPSRYCALEGLRSGRKEPPYIMAVKELYERGIRCHGFAMIRKRYLDRVPFYSVDSVSFKAAVMYGSMFSQKSDGKFGYVRPRRPRNPAEINRLVADCNVAGIALDESKMVGTSKGGNIARRDAALSRAVEGMKQMERYYTRLWRSRGIKWEEKFKEPIPA